MVLKIPPPPQFSGEQWQLFNRWLLELQSILAASGGIDTTQIPGYAELQAAVGGNTGDITGLQGEVTVLQSQMLTANANIGSLQTSALTFASEIATLQGNALVRNGSGVPSAGLGNNGDLYIDDNYPATNRLYAKIAGVWKSLV